MKFLIAMTRPLGLIVLLLLCSFNAYPQRNRTQPGALTRTQIKQAEQRLAQLGYWTGRVDGIFDEASRSALITFQKWEGRPVTGRFNAEDFEAIHNGSPARARDAGYAHVEIDVDRQVLLMLGDTGDVKLLPVSTGNGKEFLDNGQTNVTYTARGGFVVYDKVVDWEPGPIGANAIQTTSVVGVATHGARNVPN